VETGVSVRSELVVPLLMQDRLIGVLDLESAERMRLRPNTNACSSRWRRMWPSRWRMPGCMKKHDKLSAALVRSFHCREIQRQLLPTGAREVPGLDSLRLLLGARAGRDFYDFFLRQGRLAVSLGDVSGKGTAAALFGRLQSHHARQHRGASVSSAGNAGIAESASLRAHLDSRSCHGVCVYDAGERRLTLAMPARLILFWCAMAKCSKFELAHSARSFSGYGIR